MKEISKELLTNICNGSIRIPLEYRVEKDKAIELLDEIIKSSIKIKNNDIYTIASWVGKDIGTFKSEEEFSETLSIEYIGEEKTADLSIPNGNSYTANGIICHNTINLPEDVTTEKVSEIYLKSWEMGLKGITVYRSGSRSGVLISTEEKKEIKKNKFFEENHAPKRPKILDADVVRFTNEGEKWIGFIGLMDGRPYEIFTGQSDQFPIPSYVESGKIKKYKIVKKNGEKVSKYNFIFNDKNNEEIEIESLSESFNKEYWNYAKMISSILRHGMPLPYVIELINSLNLKDENLNTWKSGVSRMVKRYIKDGTKSKDTKCENCGDENGLIFEEGCLKCKSCGYGKCN
jgi:ribonucleoside-diphosphate reductase alpha chain